MMDRRRAQSGKPFPGERLKNYDGRIVTARGIQKTGNDNTRGDTINVGGMPS